MAVISNCLSGLKFFFLHRPPLVTFMACLSSFAIVLISLACAVSVYDLKNPDTRRDWNTFLERFASYELCLTGNKTAAFSRGSLFIIDSSDASLLDLTYSDVRKTVKRVSFRTKIVLKPPYGQYVSDKPVSAIGQMTGRQLGLRGVMARYLVNVTIDLPNQLSNRVKCHSDTMSCDPIRLTACVHFFAIRDVFPKTKRPRQCSLPDKKRQVTYMETLHTHSLFRSLRCRKLSKIQVEHKVDPSLTVMLSKTEKEVARNHLMNTSYVLLVCLLSFFIYGFVSENRGQYSVVHQDFDDVMK